VLSTNLAERHGTVPVHSIDEIRELAGRFPHEILLATGHLESELVAGALLFKTRAAVHTQYLASSPFGREIGALDCVIEDCIQNAASHGSRYFSFGISTEHDGLQLNEGLHTFKAEFGAGALVHETYAIVL
jgi:hypothetical protein